MVKGTNVHPMNLGFLISGLNLLLLALTGGVFSTLLRHEEPPPAPDPIAVIPSHRRTLLSAVYTSTQKRPRRANGLHRTLANRQRGFYIVEGAPSIFREISSIARR